MKKTLSLLLVFVFVFTIAFGSMGTVYAQESQTFDCNESITAYYDAQTKTLTVDSKDTAEHNMPDYDADNPPPWNDCDIESAVISAKVSSIGNFSFYNNTALKSAQIQNDNCFVTSFVTTFGVNTDLCIYVLNDEMLNKVKANGYNGDYLYVITFITADGATTVKYCPNNTRAEDIEKPQLTIAPTPDKEYTFYLRHTCGVWEPEIADVSSNATYTEKSKNKPCFLSDTTQRVITPATCTSTGVARNVCICGRVDEDEIINIDIDPNNHSFADNAEYCLNGCNTKNPSYKPTTTTTTTTATTTLPNNTTAKPIDNNVTTQSNQSNGATTAKTTAASKKPKIKKASISKLKKGKKQLTVYWKKLSSVSGYQVQYSTSKKFSKSKTKTVTIKGNKSKKPSKTIKKLKSKKKYYVRVRAYKKVKVNGKPKTYTGSWSKVKSITVK